MSGYGVPSLLWSGDRVPCAPNLFQINGFPVSLVIEAKCSETEARSMIGEAIPTPVMGTCLYAIMKQRKKGCGCGFTCAL